MRLTLHNTVRCSRDIPILIIEEVLIIFEGTSLAQHRTAAFLGLEVPAFPCMVSAVAVDILQISIGTPTVAGGVANITITMPWYLVRFLLRVLHDPCNIALRLAIWVA